MPGPAANEDPRFAICKTGANSILQRMCLMLDRENKTGDAECFIS